MFRFGQASGADRAARENARFGGHNHITELFQFGHIFLNNRIGEHIRVHGRYDYYRYGCSHNSRRHQIIGDTVGDFSDNICRSRCDDEQIGPLCQRNMFHPKFGHIPEQGNGYGITRYFSERQGGNEFRGMSRHDTLDFRAFFTEQADNHRGLIGGNTAADRQNDFLVF